MRQSPRTSHDHPEWLSLHDQEWLCFPDRYQLPAVRLPASVLWYEFRNNIVGLNGYVLTNFITDGVTEAQIDFRYHGQRFTG
jgi:hypothetical protein